MADDARQSLIDDDAHNSAGRSLSTGAKHPRSVSTASSAEPAPSIARDSVVILAMALVALLANTPSAFNAISGQFKADTGTSKFYVSLFLGVGIAGLQFTLPAGMLLDSQGPTTAIVCGGALVVGGYFGLSFTHNEILLLIEYAAVSLGSGCIFLAALSTSIRYGYPLGIGLVSLTMSLSISFSVLINHITDVTSDCSPDSDTCWRRYMRSYAVLIGAVCVVGTIALAGCGRKKSEASPAPELDSGPAPDYGTEDGRVRDAEHGDSAGPLSLAGDDDAATGRTTSTATASTATVFDPRQRMQSTNVPLSLRGATRIFKKPFFWALFWGNLSGLASGMLILTSALQMWEEYNTDQTKDHWNNLITIYFSIAASISNVVAPLLADALHSRGVMRRNRFLATVLLLSAIEFAILGVLTLVPHNHKGACHMKMFFVFMMAGAGVGFGNYLVLFPTTLEDVYGMTNFGTYMSFMQIGSTAMAFVVPIGATAIRGAFGSYNSLYWITAAMLATSAAFVGLPKPFSATFAARKAAA